MPQEYRDFLPVRAEECYNKRCSSLEEGSDVRTTCEFLSILVGDSGWASVMHADNFDVDNCASFAGAWEMYNLHIVDWSIIVAEFEIPQIYQNLPDVYETCEAAVTLDVWLED